MRTPDFSLRQPRQRLPLIRQTEAAECGLACLAMILNYHGYRTDLNTLRLEHSMSLRGASLKGLIDLAGRLKLLTRALRVDLESMGRLQTPCVLHWEMNHFVVLKAVRKNRYDVHDPALGVRRYSAAELSRSFTGVALELGPATDFSTCESADRLRLTDLWQKSTGLKRALLQTLALSIVIQLFAIASPFYMQIVVDEVITRLDTDLLIVLAAGFGLFMLMTRAANVLRSLVILHVSSMLGFQLVSGLFRHLLRLPLGWFEKRHVGDIESRFASTQHIRHLISEGLVSSVIDGIMAISTLVMMIVYSPRLAAVVLLASCVYVALRLALYGPFRRRMEEQIVAGAIEQSTFIESARGIQSIKLFGNEAQRESLWQNRYADVINSNVRIGKLQIGFDAANGILFGIENTIVIYLGALSILDAGMTIGMLFAFVAYKQHFVDKLIMLVERALEFRLLDLHLERIADIALARPELEPGGASRVSAVAGGCGDRRPTLEAVNVSFRYADEEPLIVRNASLSVTPGEMISIVGPSGAGKTTLMKLLLGLFEPTEGAVTFGGMPLSRYGHGRFREQVATVMQNDTLFAGSIAENVAFFDPNPDFEKVAGCVVSAGIGENVASMPMGFNTLIGDLGSTLSGGQQQRLLLARALYRDPEFLFLDEGTAHLDPKAETAVLETLKRHPATRICIAHRQPVIDASDRVLMLHQGQLTEIEPGKAASASATTGAIHSDRGLRKP